MLSEDFAASLLSEPFSWTAGLGDRLFLPWPLLESQLCADSSLGITLEQSYEGPEGSQGLVRPWEMEKLT